MLTGAGADRMSSGMAHSFGVPSGISAQVQDKGKVISIFCNKEQIPLVREIMHMARTKLPGQKHIIVEELK